MGEMMKPSEALRKVRELITPKGAWTQNNWARDADGYGTRPWGDNAVCWCSMGACDAVMHNEGREDYVGQGSGLYIWLDKAVAEWPSDFNDMTYRAQSEVLDAFDRAIALAEAEGQ